MASRQDRRGADQVGGPRENGRALRTLALTAVVVGLVALTTAACVLTYSSVHDFALRAGISPSLAKIYPDIGDAMLVMAGCSVLALRGAGLVSKLYAWLSFILLLGVLAASSVAHEAGLNMPLRAAEVTAAVFPWALVLVAFGLLLALLRHARRRRQSRASSAPAETLTPSPMAPEPAELEVGYDIAVYEGPGEYEGGEASYEYGTLDATPQYPMVSQEAEVPPDEPGEPVAGPTVPLPRPAVEPDDTSAQPPRAVIRPTEMQLRARTPRQSEQADASAAQTPAAEPAPPAGTSITEPPTSGFTGDTIPRGELSPAPTAPAPTELNRPRSSPTPPS